MMCAEHSRLVEAER